MKLTKGKLSKLYNKKKQSLKKVNKKKGSNKSKTFRRKRNMNLARKSLKRIRQNGGEEEEMPKANAQEVTASEIPEPQAENLTIEEQTILPEPSPIEEQTILPEPLSEIQTLPPSDIEMEPTIEELMLPEEKNKDDIEIIEPTSDETILSQGENLEQPQGENLEVEQEPQRENLEEISEVVEPQGVNLEEEQEPVEQGIEEPIEQGIEEPIEQGIEEPIQNEIQDTKKEEVKDALNTIVDYISDKVSEKVSQSVSPSTENNIQNGFDSVNNAAESLALSGGEPKKRKTRKFRIQKSKNKTRQQRSKLSK